MPSIHPSAIVSDSAKIGASAEIGPFCVIGPEVEIGARTKLTAYNFLTGKTKVGEDCELFPNVTLGTKAQSLGVAPESAGVVIGDRTILHENVMISAASPHLDQPTRIGSDCFFMVNTHIGHDCQIGNKCVFAPGVMVGGMTKVADQVWMGGGAAIHQHSWIGAHSFVGAGSIVTTDVVPFVTVQGNHAHIAAVNAVGLKRRGYSKADLREIYDVVKLLFQSAGTYADRLEQAKQKYNGEGPAAELVAFAASKRSGRPLCNFRDAK